jgi:hypothetical protein
MKIQLQNLARFALSGAFALCATAHAATVILVNADAAGQGLNDPTPATPEGGNTGTTLGQQRLIALQHAADVWAAQLESSVPIRIRVQFPTAGFACESEPFGFVYLGYSGPTAYYTGNPPFPPEPTVYPVALRNALVGTVTNPAQSEIAAQFSPLLDSTPNCMSGFSGFWYGIDRDIPIPEGNLQFPFVTLATHEFAHGLGFVSGINLNDGSGFPPYHYVWEGLLYDTQTAKYWDEMSNPERAASATNDPHLVWRGANANGAASSYLRPPARLRAGAAILAGDVLAAGFAERMPRDGLAERAVVVDDGSVNGSEGCAALINAAAVQGRIAVARRGTCGFGIKTRNAQAAGAIATLILNNRAESTGDPLPVAGANDHTLVIPTFTVAYQTGLDLVSVIGGNPNTVVTIESIPGAADLGTDAGFLRMDAPAVLEPATSVNHFSREQATPLLMKGSISLWNFDRNDMTTDLLRDLGWPLTPGSGNNVFSADFENYTPR